MVVIAGFTTIYAIVAYNHLRCEFEYRSWRDVLDATLCDKVCQWSATGRWFSPRTPVSSTNKAYRHDITEIVLKVVLNTITPYVNLTHLQNCLIYLLGQSHTNIPYHTTQWCIICTWCRTISKAFIYSYCPLILNRRQLCLKAKFH